MSRIQFTFNIFSHTKHSTPATMHGAPYSPMLLHPHFFHLVQAMLMDPDPNVAFVAATTITAAAERAYGNEGTGIAAGPELMFSTFSDQPLLTKLLSFLHHLTTLPDPLYTASAPDLELVHIFAHYSTTGRSKILAD